MQVIWQPGNKIQGNFLNVIIICDQDLDRLNFKDKFGEIGGIGSPSGDEKTNQFGCGNYKATAVVNDVNEADCDGKSKTWRDGWKNEGEKMRKQK